MANVNVTAERIAELGGASNSGVKIGFIDSAAYATQNDTWTVTNASEVLFASVKTDADGIDNVTTISTNVLTLTDATTGAASGIIIFK